LKGSQLIVITDLDGTLLDQETYSYEASQPAIKTLKSLQIPLTLCSSKTRSEIVVLWEELELKDPFISENGGAIYFLRGYFPNPAEGDASKERFEAIKLGTDISDLRQRLQEAAEQCGVQVRTFAAMTPAELSRLSGLSQDQARLALEREYDEPFVVERGDQDKLFDALRKKDLTVTYGGRFFHVTGGHDKGRAVRTLLDLFRRSGSRVWSVGLGNSANDLPLLENVDRPVLVRNFDGSYDEEVIKALPSIERTQAIGPKGWRESIEKVLGSRTR
jgi:mannosyl-3-phosphoglycerate phosphatase family protein